MEIPKGIPPKTVNPQTEKLQRKISPQNIFTKSVDILLFRRYNGERAVETAAQQNKEMRL